MKNYMTIFALMFSSVGFAIGPNDISVLLPLPLKGEINLLISPFESGHKGELLPKIFFDKASLPLLQPATDASYTENVKAISIRIDPCFIDSPGPVTCRRQIRIVWQVLQFSTYLQGYYGRDAAIHTFYEFSESDWNQLKTSWLSLANGNPSDYLSIHPAIQSEGLSGVYWSSLKKVILDFCGASNLKRVSFFLNLQGESSNWKFEGYNIENNEAVAMAIPQINSTEQHFTNFSLNFQTFQISGPKDSRHINLNQFITKSYAPEVTTEEMLRKTLIEVRQIENPLIHNPGTTDCLSCHASQAVQVKLENEFLASNLDFPKQEFSTSTNLENKNKIYDTRIFRSFGYFKNKPIISQRVINETGFLLQNYFLNQDLTHKE